MKPRHCRRLVTTLLFLTILAALAASALAAPMFGAQWKLRQPDGTWVDVLIFGDEYYQDVETPNGYTLIRDPVTNVICYARLSSDGKDYVSTGVRVGTQSPISLGLQPHLRITPESRRAKAASTRAVAYAPEKQMLAASGMDALLGPPDDGNVLGLCLLADFSDQVATIPQGDVVNFCNQIGYNQNGNNGSVRDYFFDVSDGALTYTHYVSPTYYRPANPFSWYDDCDEPWLDRGKQLIVEILDDMEADGFDFSGYDSNSDGLIDAVNLFYAGNTGCGWAEGMWPGSGAMGGFSEDGVSINRFQLTGMGGSLTIGTYCHENGHMICYYPDLYDYDDDSNGVGDYCLMASGGPSTNPTEVCAPLKVSSGWATVNSLTTKATGLSLPSGTNTYYEYERVGDVVFPDESFLIENRQKTGRDASLPDAGLTIWHVEPTWGDHNDQSMTTFGHFPYTVVQADNDWDLENDINNGDSQDLYSSPGSTALTACTEPNSDWWDGSVSGFNVTNVGPIGANMTFDFSPDDDAPIAQVQAFEANASDDCCITVSVDDIDNGSYDPDGVGDVASLCITAVDAAPVACVQSLQVCGAGSHTVTLTITDLCGNTDSEDATVTVVDITAPDVTIELNRDVLWPPNHKMAEICAEVTVTDNCDAAPAFVLESIWSDEPDDGAGDGHFPDDIQNADYGDDDTCFDLRSERQGTEDGREYTIVYCASDDSGNEACDTVYVRVPHDQGVSALASTGYLANGSGFDPEAEQFALIIPAVDGIETSTLAREDIYLGNIAGVLRPEDVRVVEQNNDGRGDLALFFSTAKALELLTAQNTGENARELKMSNGPLGVHFVTGLGTDCLVFNILDLGEPVEMPIGADQPPMPFAEPDVVVKSTGLKSVYPNPFNPQTTVSFSLAQAGLVRIAVYDVRGALVSRLADEVMPGGDHSLVWHGTDSQGHPAASGIYFLRMITGSYSETRKLVLLK